MGSKQPAFNRKLSYQNSVRGSRHGEENLQRRIETAQKALDSASPVYREYFVRRKQFLWIGAHQIRQLLKAKLFGLNLPDPSAIAALHNIACIRNVAHTMPSWQKKEFRTRLTDKAAGDLPALIEIAAASRIVTLGGKIKWIPEQKPATIPIRDLCAVRSRHMPRSILGAPVFL